MPKTSRTFIRISDRRWPWWYKPITSVLRKLSQEYLMVGFDIKNEVTQEHELEDFYSFNYKKQKF
jgi:hypothetical protein